MITRFVNAFTDAEPTVLASYTEKHPGGYDEIFGDLVRLLSTSDEYGAPDPERITVIDHSDYRGSRVFIVGAGGYQPSRYWGVVVSYGSCSGCDAFESIRGYSDGQPSEDQARQYLDLMRHMVQGLRPLHSATFAEEDA